MRAWTGKNAAPTDEKGLKQTSAQKASCRDGAPDMGGQKAGGLQILLRTVRDALWCTLMQRAARSIQGNLVSCRTVVPAKPGVRRQPRKVSRNGQAGTQGSQALPNPRLRGGDIKSISNFRRASTPGPRKTVLDLPRRRLLFRIPVPALS